MSTTTIQALDLEPGDTIVADGAIAINVTNVRPPICGLVSVAYEFLGGSGFRIYATTQRVDVQRASRCNCSHGPDQHASWCAAFAPSNCGALCAEMNAGCCPGSGCAYAQEIAA